MLSYAYSELENEKITLLYSKDNMFHRFSVCSSTFQIVSSLDRSDPGSPDSSNNEPAFLINFKHEKFSFISFSRIF